MTKKIENYGEPWHLGARANTSYSEMYPYIGTSLHDKLLEPYVYELGAMVHKGYGSPLKTNGEWTDYFRRIVACVNACSGIPTEELETGKLELKTKFFSPVDTVCSTEANARLIAAAPDLLAALEGMVRCYETLEMMHRVLPASKESVDVEFAFSSTHSIQNAKAAIKRAKRE